MRKNVLRFLVTLTLLSGCGHEDQVVKYTAPSPDGLLQASLIEEGFGATVSEVYSVQILQGDKEPAEVMRADHVRNLAFRWRDKNTLEISMDCGRIFQFTNFFDVIDQNGKLVYGINVRLTNTSLCDAR